MLQPIIDKRDKKELIEQMKEIVPYYTPEWRFNPSDPDPGSALVLIFADMFIENIKRYNKVPLKHFIAFLNLFNVSLNTPQSSVAFTTFYLSDGAKEDVYIQKGTKVSAFHDEVEVIFETEKNLLVTPALITDAYKVSANPDKINKVDTYFFVNQQAEMNQELRVCNMYNFDDENVQEHTMYLSHSDMFNLSSTVRIEIVISHPFKRYKENEMAQSLADQDYVEWMYYGNGSWHSFDVVEWLDNKVILYKAKLGIIEEKEIEGIEGKWIKCKVKAINSGEESAKYVQIELGQLHVKTDHDTGQGGFLPDMLFNDDIHIYVEEQTGFYPFGEYFRPYSIFYLSSQEAFSKKGSQISVQFILKSIANEMQTQVEQEIDWKLIMKESKIKKADPHPISILKVMWEYWNGQAWVALPMDQEYQEIFYYLPEEAKDISMHFICPVDLEETFVNGIPNYWIRARVLTIDHIFSTEVHYLSPWIEKIKLFYQSDTNYQLVQQCVTHNNLMYEDQGNLVKTDGAVFCPYSVIESAAPAFYLGFDRAPTNGPISIFFSFFDFNVTEMNKPVIEWEYLRKKGNQLEWVPLKVIDQTNSFTRSGEARFLGPLDFAYESIFSKQRYWIRLLNRNTNVQHQTIQTPRLKGIHLNTAKVIQQVEILDENPIKMTDDFETSYQLIHFPVLSEEVWVDESNHISEEQVARFLKEDNDRIKVLRDSEQNIQRCWIKWESVTHFLESTEDERHYVINRSEGKIMFGDGVNGKNIPNPQSDYILVHYYIGGGTIGNIDRYQINQLHSAIPFIQAVSNPEPAGGGSNVEKLEDALTRGSKLIKHRNRAVTTEDFEWLVREASQNVSKVKCLSNYNSRMEKEVGSITIVILPESGVEGLQVFPELKVRIEKYIMERTANTLAFPEKIQVIKPAFLEISLHAILVVENMDMVVETELEALQRINQFLDPLSGHDDGKGWDIGQQIHSSICYSFLRSIRHVNFVDKLYMTVHKIEHGERTEIIMTEDTYIPHGIVVNGEHRVSVKVL